MPPRSRPWGVFFALALGLVLLAAAPGATAGSPPQWVTFATPPPSPENALLSFSVGATTSDPPVAYAIVSSTPSAAGMTIDPASGAVIWTPTCSQHGTYSVTFRATDADGDRKDRTMTGITITDVNCPPVLASIGAKSGPEGDEIAFAISATDADGGDILTYTMPSGPPGASFDDATRTFTWTPGYDVAEGASPTATFQVSDGTVTDGEEVTFTIADTDRAPVFDPVDDQTVEEEDTLTFSVSASDPDGDDITLDASGSAVDAGGSFDPDTGEFTWTPGFDDDGEHEVVFTATSNGLTGSETVIITVANVNREPTVEVTFLPPSPRAGRPVTFDVEVDDPDGDAVTWTIDPGDGEDPVSGADDDDVPYVYATAGTWTATLVADDGSGDDVEATVEVTVVANLAPVVTLDTDDPEDTDAPFAAVVSADVEDEATLESWTYDTDDGTVLSGVGDPPASFAHTYDVPGTYEAVLTVVDDVGEEASSDPLVIVVTDGGAVVNPAPSIDFQVDPLGLQRVELVFTLDDADGISGWTIDWGDDSSEDSGSDASGSVEHAYDAAGDYEIALTATDAHAEPASRTVVVPITVVPTWGAEISADPVDGDAPLSVVYTLTVDSLDGVESAEFYPGLGSPIPIAVTGFPTTRAAIYPTPGVYEATLTLRDIHENEEVVTYELDVNDIPSILDVERSISGLTASFEVFVDDDDTWKIELVTLDDTQRVGLGAGPRRTITYTYAESGTYEACITVTDADGAGSQEVCTSVTVTKPRTSSGGGGSGGGGGGSGLPPPPAPPKPVPVQENAAEANATGVAVFQGGTVVELRLAANVTVVQNTTDPGPGEVLAFTLEARDDNGTRVEVRDVVVRFAVPETLLPNGTRAVLVHDGVPLPTTLVGEEDGALLFEATTPSFSPFAVVLDREDPTLLPLSAASFDAALGNPTFAVDDDAGLRSVEAMLDGVHVEVVERDMPAAYLVVVPGPFDVGVHVVHLRLEDLAGRVVEADWAFEALASTRPVEPASEPVVAPAPRVQVPEEAEAVIPARHPFVAFAAFAEGLALAASFRAWGPQVAKVVTRPRIKSPKREEKTLSETRCDLCLGAFKSAALMHACACGVKLHGSCYVRAGTCPGCGSKDGLEDG